MKKRPDLTELIGIAVMAAIIMLAIMFSIWLYHRMTIKSQVNVRTYSERTLSPDLMKFPQETSVKVALHPVKESPYINRPGAISKSAEFNHLKESKNVHDQARAYWMAMACYEAHREFNEGFVPELDAARCGDIQEGQYDNAELRQSLLKEASKKGVHRTWLALRSREGPQGMYPSIPEGESYHAWEQEAFQAALKTADPYALASLSRSLQDKGDFAGAIKIFVASATSLARDKGIQNYDPSQDPAVTQLKIKGGLDNGVVLQAIAEGTRYSAQAPKELP